MSEERRKINKSSTGTVPKIKQRNNTFSGGVNEERSRSITNNVGYRTYSPYSNLLQNPRKNLRNNYYTMDANVEESVHNSQNGIGNENSSSVNTSSSTSRRNSSNSTLKCDNVTKCPDKKQIEDKLNQIREYLKITNTLMNNMKNNEEYTVTTDGDEVSERSSSSLRKNDAELKLDLPDEISSLKEQQLSLLKLQQKAEKKLRDARSSNLFNPHNPQSSGNEVQQVKENNNYQQFDKAIKDLEERARRLRPAESSQQNVHDSILAKVESLHNQIMVMHDANDEREELIQTLDNRDTELRTQHAELQNKLVELQNKKMQVDQLVAQLQAFGEDDEEDVGGQVRKIVTMKDQLQKLKDMLELVKNTETVMQNTNATPEEQAAACEICTTAENYLEKEFEKPKIQPSLQNDTNVLRYDNDTSLDNIPKQLNKNSRKQGGRDASMYQKIALQTKLESKKRELEDLMGKHKASSSNLNHDVGIDTKSEYSCGCNSVNEGWIPLPRAGRNSNSDRFSCDCEDDVNQYQEIIDNHNVRTLSSNHSPLNTTERRFVNSTRPEYSVHSDYVGPQGSFRTTNRNFRSSSVGAANCVREQPRANSDMDMKNQVQKQLQLIKSVCDSMLEQQSVLSQPNANVQHLRNNLTPSSLYSDQRRFPVPNTHTVTNPNLDIPWFSPNSETSSYQGWLTTNTIQTQSFMLNTLNQCCQMLWLQQRELVSLRNTVSALQERIDNQHGAVQDDLSSPIQMNSQENPSSNQFRCIPIPKVNHVSAAYSLPNLNGHPSNVDANFINHSNSHNSQILDPSLNNVNSNPLNAQSVEHANNGLHGVNANINHSLSNQMWNGQALNNQVAPGNRANNYWDNFRSYSRQNLLSTKNSELMQNCQSSLERTDRPNTIMERTNPFTLMTFSKSNSDQDSASTSQENTLQRRGNWPIHVRVQPDVLNINQPVHKSREHLHAPTSSRLTHHQENIDNINQGFQNLNAFNDNSSNHSNLSEEHGRECVTQESRRHNDWNYTTVTDENTPKSKLFDELRENVYKEVVSLISANESRPHFLIQLFRDLQMIGSDALRMKILHSIQTITTHSLLHSQNSNRPSAEYEQTTEQVVSVQKKLPTLLPKPQKNSASQQKCYGFTEVQNIFRDAIDFLNLNEEEIIRTSFVTTLKDLLLNSGPFKEAVKDIVVQKHFSNILDEILEQYIGRKAKNIKMYLLETLNELFYGDLGFIQIIHETSSEKGQSHPTNDRDFQNTSFSTSPNIENSRFEPGIVQTVKIQNGDLCEADQTRVLDDDDMEEEVEGAVGGIMEPQQHVDANNAITNQINNEDKNLAYVSSSISTSSSDDMDLDTELACNCEGLDQIPTRLPMISKSRSTTPNKD